MLALHGGSGLLLCPLSLARAGGASLRAQCAALTAVLMRWFSRACALLNSSKARHSSPSSLGLTLRHSGRFRRNGVRYLKLGRPPATSSWPPVAGFTKRKIDGPRGESGRVRSATRLRRRAHGAPLRGGSKMPLREGASSAPTPRPREPKPVGGGRKPPGAARAGIRRISSYKASRLLSRAVRWARPQGFVHSRAGARRDDRVGRLSSAPYFRETR